MELRYSTEDLDNIGDLVNHIWPFNCKIRQKNWAASLSFGELLGVLKSFWSGLEYFMERP